MARRGTVLGNLCGIGLFSSALDVVGAGTRLSSDRTRVRFLGFSGQAGLTPDLPVMVVAYEVSSGASPGQQGSLEIIESSLRLEAPGGTIYRNDLKQGTVTVGGISINEVIPSNGIIPAGTEIRFRGVGFRADSRIDIDGVSLTNQRLSGPGEIVAVAGQTFRIDNRRIRLRNDNGDADFFYAFTSAKLEPRTSNPLLRTVIPILSPQTLTQGTLPAMPNLLGLTVRNWSGNTASVRVRAFDSSGAVLADRTSEMADNSESTLTPSEWTGGGDLSSAVTIAVESTQPVQALGMLLEGDSFVPTVLGDGPIPQPPPVAPQPKISSGGWVLAGFPPFRTGIAPLAITTLFGQEFAPEGFSQTASPSDIAGGKLPTRLGGVCVEIDGTPSPLYFVNANQINLQALADTTGSVSAVVVRGCGTADESRSSPELVSVSARLPAWFVMTQNASGSNPIAALHGGGPDVAASPADVPSATPAAPGDVVSLFATGLGLTEPPLAPGAIPLLSVQDGLARVTGIVEIRIGGQTLSPNDVFCVGAAPCCAGLYQVVIRVPTGLAPGQHPVEINADGAASPPGPYLTVQNP